MTIRLLAQYQGNPPNTIVTLAGGVETALVAAGNATTTLSGGVPPVHVTPANSQIGDVLYGPDGVPLGVADPTGKLLSNFTGITAPGAPTGVTLTPIAGGVLAAFTPSATLGGTVGTGFEVTLSNGRVQRGAASPIPVNSPAGSVTATVKQMNGAGLSAASAASASATVPAYIAPTTPGAPTSLTLTAGNGKVTANWTAAAANGSAIRNTVVTLSNGATATALNSATTVDVVTPNDVPVTATARANNGEGAGPTSAVSNSVTPGNVASAPLFTASPAVSDATLGEPVTYSTGTASGSPAPTIATELMVWGRPQPISTVLTEVHRHNISATAAIINVRQIATNSQGVATRMAPAGLRANPDANQDPRWDQHPYFKGLPQVGRPVYLGGLTPLGTGTMVSNHKFCVSDTPVVEGRIDAAAFAAAVSTTGTTSGLNTQSSATATYPVGEVGKYAYAVVSMSNGTNTIYFRTKSWQVIPAGVATNTYRFATAGGNKLADRIYTNNTGVQMNVFGYVDVVIGSVQHGALKVVLANLAMPDSSINAPVGSGSDFTFLSAALCVPSAASTSSPSVLFGGVQGTIADGTYDVLSDVMMPSAFGGKTAHNAGDHLIFKYEIAIAPGGKLPYVSGGDLTTGTQAYLFNPANTTISNKNNGNLSAYGGTAPSTSVGDGIPFDIIGLQVTGDAPVDFIIGDSIAFNPQGRSYWAAAHYLCEKYGSPAIANSNGGRIGATHALFNNHAYLQSKIKYANRIFIEVGTNTQSPSNVGNANAQIALDNTTLGLIAANVAPTVAGLTATTVVRMKLLLAFSNTNDDTSNYSATTAETQKPLPSYSAGGDLETYFYPYLESQVPAKYARVLDVRPALRLSDDTTSADYYKAQPNTFEYESGSVVHTTPLGGIQAGMFLRELLAA